MRGLLFAAAAYREQLVQNFYDMGRRAVEAGTRGGPFAFIIPPEQHDPLHDREARESAARRARSKSSARWNRFAPTAKPYPAGTDIIFLAQPYRAYVKTLLERQSYPARRATANGPADRPYDVAGWTLPQQMGVNVITIERSFEPPPTSRLTTATIAPATVWGERKPGYWVVDASGNGGAIAVNRLSRPAHRRRGRPFRLEASGFRYEPGSIVVPYVKSAESAVATIARELGLRVDGVKGKVPQNLRRSGAPG